MPDTLLQIDQMRNDLIMKLLSVEEFNFETDFLDRYDEGIKVGRYELAQELLNYLDKEWKITIEVN